MRDNRRRYPPTSVSDYDETGDEDGHGLASGDEAPVLPPRGRGQAPALGRSATVPGSASVRAVGPRGHHHHRPQDLPLVIEVEEGEVCPLPDSDTTDL